MATTTVRGDIKLPLGRGRGHSPATESGDHEGAEYGDTSNNIWGLYGTESEKHDKALVDSWIGNTDPMLTFTGLFSLLVALFFIETYKTLTPGSGPGSQTADSSAMRVNVFMFLSLFFSVTSALASTLLRQWAREYLQYSRPSAAPHKRGRVRAYLFDGLSQSQIRRLSYAVPVLFHLAVFLFFYALSEWLYSVNVPVGAKARHCLVALLAIYFGLSVLPLIVRNTPYQTALTIPLQACVSLIRVLYLGLYQYVRCSSGVHEGQEGSGVFESANINRDRVLIEDIKSKASNPDRSAMHWLLNELDEDNMDNFLSGLPGYLRSPLTDTKVVVEGLIEDGLPERIREHITTCVTSAKLSQEESMSRAVACINSLRLISKTAANTAIQRPGLGNDIQAIMECLEPLCYNPFTSLRALCIRGLVIREFPIPPPPLRAESEGADVTDSDEEGARAFVVTLTESQIEPARNSASVLKNQKRTPKRSRTTNAFASTSATGSGSKATKKGTRAPPKKKAVLENIRIPDDEVLSYEQKKDLSEAIRTLDEQKLARVNEIIYEGLPETRDAPGDIVLEIDEIPASVLTDLYNFVVRRLP